MSGLESELGPPGSGLGEPLPDPDGADLNPVPTPLDGFCRAHGGRMVAYAGHFLPVRFDAGVMEEHLHCRRAAALFDVSHMGQALLRGPDAAAALERLVPSELASLPPGGQRYTMLLNEAGGIIDDLIVTRLDADTLFLVVNGARREIDFAHLERALPPDVAFEPWEDRALLAVQGPAAADAIATILPGAERLGTMTAGTFPFDGVDVVAARCGYTGEDGFELSCPADRAEILAARLLAHDEVGMAGLGARDSLRLEAGLPLYGADLDALTTPVEAGLAFTVARSRRETGGFVGDTVVLSQLRHGVTRRRMGLLPDGRAPARAGTVIVGAHGTQAGTVTSGGFGPSVGAPISMGYVTRDLAEPGTAVSLLVRGRQMPARVAALPFLPTRPRLPARPA